MDSVDQRNQVWPAIRLPLQIAPQVVHVIRVRLDLPPLRWNALRELLTEDELKRADRYRFDEPRQRFIICRATLRQLLASCCGVAPIAVPLRYNHHGKPALAIDRLNATSPPIEFSVSHSGDIGLIAMTQDAIVGIDIEEYNPKVNATGLAKRFFAAAEFEELSRLPAVELLPGFYRGWTCKEAYIKATGRGLSLPLSSFVVTMDPKKPASLLHVDDLPNESARWTVSSIEVTEDYAGALMVAQPDSRIECWDWP